MRDHARTLTPGPSPGLRTPIPGTLPRPQDTDPGDTPRASGSQPWDSPQAPGRRSLGHLSLGLRTLTLGQSSDLAQVSAGSPACAQARVCVRAHTSMQLPPRVSIPVTTARWLNSCIVRSPVLDFGMATAHRPSPLLGSARSPHSTPRWPYGVGTSIFPTLEMRERRRGKVSRDAQLVAGGGRTGAPASNSRVTVPTVVQTASPPPSVWSAHDLKPPKTQLVPIRAWGTA